MSEVATIDETASAIDLIPPSQAPSVSAQRMLVAHAEMMQTAWELASKMVLTTMVPPRFARKAEDATAAILYGAELGLNPIQSLQRIIPIHGMPSLEARTMVALLKARGYKVRTAAQSDESVTVVGVDLDGDVYESTWTIERAVMAGYVPTQDEKTGKYKLNANGKLIGNEKYLTDPQAMLKAKAQAEVCRDMAPDVLLGIAYASEELESERFDQSALPATTTAGAPAPLTVEEVLGDDPPPAEAEKPKRKPKAKKAAAEKPAEPGPEPGQGGGNDVSEGAEPSSGADLVADSHDQAEAAAEAQQETPPTEPASPAAPVEERLMRLMHVLFAKADLSKNNREDRLTVTRWILHRDDINSSSDLDGVEVKSVVDTLSGWDRDGVLGEQVTEILNEATIKAENAAAAAEADTDTDTDEGN